MSDEIQCFMLEKTNLQRRWLRRYKSDPVGVSSCPGRMGYHDALTHLDDVEVVQGRDTIPDGSWPHDDPRWPAACACGYVFTPDDQWQLFNWRLFKGADNGELCTLHDPIPGAMWYATWMPSSKGGGHPLMVALPNGRIWNIDGRCNNCDMPDDYEHRCWIRHGTPPMITVDKAGLTCGAGAGSIKAGDYHGFLRDGKLVRA